MPDYPAIQGETPDSWQEVYFAFALEKYKIPYEYQWFIGKGGLRGTIVVDFVLSLPFRQPVEIFGRHWHEGELGADDRMKLSIEAQYFGRETIVIWSDELPDQDAADEYVRREFV